MEYSVGFPTKNNAVTSAITKLPERVWTAALAADGVVRDNTEVAELTGLLDLSRSPAGMRVIVRREHPHPGAQLSLFEEHDGYRYQPWQPTPAAVSWRFWRPGTEPTPASRTASRPPKTPDSAGSPPTSTINQAWVQIAAVAADLTCWLQLLALDDDLAKAEPKMLRFRMLHVPARLVSSGHRRRLQLPRPAPSPGVGADPMNVGSVITSANDLGERFRIVNQLPTATLALFVLGLVWSGAPGSQPNLTDLAKHARQFGGWQALLLFLSVVIVALVLEPLQLAMVRALEGYWGENWLGQLLSAPGKAFHRWRLARLNRLQQREGGARPRHQGRREEAARKLMSYPPASDVLPTKLGNSLRAAELRAGSPYGLDALATWPRLYPLLGERIKALVDDLRNQLDLSVRFCSVFLAGAVIAACFLVGHGWWLAVSLIPLLLGWLAYRSALAAANAFGNVLATAFDLHRFDLLDALHLPLPGDQADELASNEELSSFLDRRAEYVFVLTKRREKGFSYDHRRPETSPPQAPAPIRGRGMSSPTSTNARGNPPTPDGCDEKPRKA